MTEMADHNSHVQPTGLTDPTPIRTLRVSKADPASEHPRDAVESVRIDISAPLWQSQRGMPNPSIQQMQDAQDIVELMWRALPGSTLDLVIAGMLERKASQLRVAHR